MFVPNSGIKVLSFQTGSNLFAQVCLDALDAEQRSIKGVAFGWVQLAAWQDMPSAD